VASWRRSAVGRRGHLALDPMHGADTEATFLGDGANALASRERCPYRVSACRVPVILTSRVDFTHGLVCGSGPLRACAAKHHSVTGVSDLGSTARVRPSPTSHLHSYFGSFQVEVAPARLALLSVAARDGSEGCRFRIGRQL
jgi:hypothetical protein